MDQCYGTCTYLGLFRGDRTEQTEQTIEIYALAIAFARTNVPLGSERTWTLFHHPLHQQQKSC